MQLSFDACTIEAGPEKLNGERAYDSDKPDAKLAAKGIEMTAPHRSNWRMRKTQDGRASRRYERRWLARWEFHPGDFLGFLRLACSTILRSRFRVNLRLSRDQRWSRLGTCDQALGRSCNSFANT